MLKICIAAALCLAAGVSHADDMHLGAGGDGVARLALQADGVGGVLRVRADFDVDVLVKDSTEAHSKARSFIGEIRIDGKPCSDARARLHAEDGRARAHASTSCSIGSNGDHPVNVEAVVVKNEDMDRDDVRVTLSAEKGSH
jgi:hypothetical protein